MRHSLGTTAAAGWMKEPVVGMAIGVARTQEAGIAVQVVEMVISDRAAMITAEAIPGGLQFLQR